MKKITSRVLGLGIFGLVLIGFQNCSTAKFGSNSLLSGEGEGSVQGLIANFKPALAVRSPNCINCHGNTLNSNLITDFGHGDDYFFAQNGHAPNAGDFVYSLRLDHSTNAIVPDWAEAQQYAAGSQILVPKADLGFRYADLMPPGTPIADWMTQTTLASLLSSIAQLPNAESTPVVEKSTVYIGVPTPGQLRAAGGLTAANPQTYFKNEVDSPALQGLVGQNGVWTNAGVVVCEGDVFIDGTVFLNALSLQTATGCRIQATGPIFLQKAITYVNATATSNLQLLSARLISLGVGNTHCESASNPGWYVGTNHQPTELRFKCLVDPSCDNFKDVRTRNMNATSVGEKTAATPLGEGSALLAIAQSLPGLEDASCHGRDVAFQHLMLVAPQVHSRYRQNFTGVIVAEFPLMSLGRLSFTFDPLFENVKVFPMLPADQILQVR